MRTATVSRQSVSQATVSQTATPRSREKSQKVAASQQNEPGPLRLTRRGRVVLTGLIALLITGLGVGTGTAQAANSASSRGERGDAVRVTVSQGESLWSVAENTDPGVDPRGIILEIVARNHLAGTTIYPGEQLWVPRQLPRHAGGRAGVAAS
jgi:LysM repeat protein